MKNLFKAQKDPRDENFAGFAVNFTTNPDGPSAPIPEEEGNIEQKIDKAMKSPLGFGVKELRFLEENENKMTAFQLKRFRNIAGYQISLARGKDMEDLPPRMLNHLVGSPLIKILPKRMQNQIVAEVDTQMRSLGNILSKNINNWSTFELSKVCVLYRRLRKNAVAKDGSRDGVFEDARKKIVAKAFKLMTKSITKSDEVYDVVEKKDNKIMTLEEKLLVMEIRRMFPREKSWAEKSKFYNWDKIAVNSITSMFSDPDKKTSLLVNPNMAFTWELLRDFLGENSGLDSAGSLQSQIITKIGEKELNKAFRTTEAIKFLQFAKNSRVFLPTHLQALQEIIDNEKNEETRFHKLLDLKDWEQYTEKYEDLEKLKSKKTKLEEKTLKFKQYGLESFFKLPKGGEERIKIENEWKKSGVVDVSQLGLIEKEYNSCKEGEEGVINKCWDEKFSSWIDKGAAALETVKNDQISDLKLQQAKELAKISNLDEADRPNYIATIKGNYRKKIEKIEGIPAKLEEFKAAIPTTTTPEARNKKIEELNSFLHKNGAEVQEVEGFKEYKKEYGEFIESVREWDNKKIKISKEVPINGSLEEERKEILKDLDKIQEEVTRKTKSLEAYKAWGEILKDPKKVAEKATSAFIGNLNIRIRNNNLYAADFDVLWGDELTDPENPYYDELSEFRGKLSTIPSRGRIDEFREKFRGILGGIFDETTLPDIAHLNEGDDKFSPWYKELDNALSYDNIIARLKAEGFDLREKFESPQQISQLIDGAIRSYRDDIFAVVLSEADDLSPDEEKQFYAGWDRLHGGLHGAMDPTQVHQKHMSYEQSKLDTSAKIEDAHQVNLAYVEGLKKKAREETDPAKKAHYKEEADKLEESFAYRKQAYQSGGNFWGKDAEGNDKQFWAPGKDLLNELDLQTQGIAKEISKITNDLKRNIAEIAENFRGISQIKDPVDKRLRQSEAKRDLEELIGKWPGVRGKLQGKFSDMGTIITEVIPAGVAPDQFVNVILEVPEKMLKSFEATFHDLEKYAKKVDFKFTGEEPFWKIFADNFIKLENALNFQSGTMAKEGEFLDKYLEESNKTLEFLTKIQFFDDNSAEKDEFTKNYNEISSEFKADFAKYKESVDEVNSRLRRDIKRLDDQKFFEKYGLDKNYMEGMLNQHKSTSQQFSEMSSKFMHPGFLKDWIHRYDTSPQDRAEAITEMGDFRALRDHAKNAKEYATNMKKWITNYDDLSSQKDTKNYQKFSLYDLYAIVKQAIEVHERRWKRDSDKAVANIGMSFFGEESSWGKEFKQKAEESEEARVKEFETQYDEVAGWDLQEALYRVNDPDEAKALIRLLLKKGFMQWDDPKFWKTLERLSNGAVKFRDPEDRSLSSLEILEKVRNSCEFIWSRETFREWDTTLEGSLKTAIDGHAADFARYENDSNARTQILATMLKRWKNGDSTNVDPAKFECFIKLSFENGKMNGQPDQRFYFLIMGASTINPNTGRALLSRDVFMRMNKDFLVRYPHVDFFADKSSWKLDGRIVPKGTPGAREGGGWVYDDYIKWGEMLSDSGNSFDPRTGEAKENTLDFFYQVVHASGDARSRVNRMDRFADKEGDHDDAKSFFMEWDQTKVADHLSKSSDGANKSSADFWRTYLAGFPVYMEQMKKYIKDGDSRYGNVEYWNVEKKRALMEVGERLKTALTVTQTLQGNGNLGEKRGSMVLERSQWNKAGGGFSYSAKDAKENINSFMRGVFDETDGGGELNDILDYMGVDVSISFKDRDPVMEKKGITRKLKLLIDDNKSREIYFENTKAIETVLMNWTPPKNLEG